MSRRSLRTVAVATAVAAVVLVSHLTAQTPAVSLADYQRAVGLQARFTGKATGVTGGAVWLASGKFWYRRSVPGGHTFVMVDPASGTKAAAFDEARLATALGQATGATYTALTLPFSTFTMDDEGRAIRFSAGESGWSCTVGEVRLHEGSGARRRRSGARRAAFRRSRRRGRSSIAGQENRSRSSGTTTSTFARRMRRPIVARR